MNNVKNQTEDYTLLKREHFSYTIATKLFWTLCRLRNNLSYELIKKIFHYVLRLSETSENLNNTIKKIDVYVTGKNKIKIRIENSYKIIFM